MPKNLEKDQKYPQSVKQAIIFRANPHGTTNYKVTYLSLFFLDDNKFEMDHCRLGQNLHHNNSLILMIEWNMRPHSHHLEHIYILHFHNQRMLVVY